MLYLFIFLFPWQIVFIWQENFLGGEKWQYGTYLTYGTELLLWVIILLYFISKYYSSEKLVINKKKCFLASLFIVWAGLSIFFSADNELSLYHWLRLLEGGLLFFIILGTKLDLKKVSWSFVLAGVFQSVLAMDQFFFQRIIASKWLGMSQQLSEDLGVVVISDGAHRFLRAYGTFSHPNVLGGFLVVCLMFSLLIYFFHSSGRLKVISLAFGILIFVAVLFSFSRSAILAFLLSYALLYIYLLSKKRFWEATKVLSYLALVFILLFSLYQSLFITRLEASEELEVNSVQLRFDSIDTSKDIIGDNFMFGVGIGNYTYVLANNNPGLMAWQYQPVHNIFLMVFSELGIIGFMIFSLLCVSLFSFSVYNIKSNPIGVSLLVIVFTIGLFDHYLWTNYVGIILFWLVLALTTQKTNEI